MKPEVPEATRFLASRLRDDIAPALTGFRAGNAGMTAAMIDMIADRWDGEAERLATENAALRPLIEECAACLGIAADISPHDPSLRISTLTHLNDAMRVRLTELHAALETSAAPEAAELDDRIWRFLAESVARQRISSANF